MYHYPIRGAVVALLVLAAGAGGSAAEGLPGGATSLSEAHGDWTVTCTTADGAVRCAMVQNQVSGENRQRVLSAELTAVEDGTGVDGVLVLPFGLRLDAGVELGIDENTAMPQRRFSTCIPAGCLVPVAFDADTTTAVKSGEMLHIAATANDNDQEIALSISLSGFTSAFDRIVQLRTQ